MSGSSISKISLHGVSKVFGSVVALRGVDVTFETGETSIVVGHNGAGKSTLLSIVATLTRPTTGEVLYDGETGARLGSKLRGAIGYAAESPLGYAELTGRENILLGARAHGLDDPEGRTAEVVALLGLSDVATRPTRGYSLGELRRLALAKALVHTPAVLLLDEPTAGLDLMGASRLAKLIANRAGEGALVIISTHDPWLGAELGGRVVTLEAGTISDVGRAPEDEAAWREMLGAPP